MIDYSLLIPEFAAKVQELLPNCAARGVTMVPYMGLRTPQQQGADWRKGRDTDTINAQIQDLRDQQADFLADCIEQAGPQDGPIVTNAIPGYSEHQTGGAVDCYVLNHYSGQPSWNDPEGYQIYQEEAAKLGLFQAFYDKTKDIGHIQMRPTGSSFGTPAEVNAVMQARFGEPS